MTREARRDYNSKSRTVHPVAVLLGTDWSPNSGHYDTGLASIQWVDGNGHPGVTSGYSVDSDRIRNLRGKIPFGRTYTELYDQGVPEGALV